MSTPMVFVVGTGRCGTHTLWKLFESVPNTLSTHEGTGIVKSGPPAHAGKRVGLGCMPELNSFLYHYASEAEFERTFAPDAAMTALMDGCFAGRASAVAWCAAHGIAYCDANPFAFNFINYLHARYPHAKFIHLVRDGYACVRSWFRRDASTYPDDVPSVSSAIEWLLAKPVPFPSETAYAKWASFDRVQKIAWFWSTVNANIARRLERVPAQNWMVVRVEDVDAANAGAILDFCGLPRQFAPEALAPEDSSQSEGRELEW
ncbi:MAG TPA: sulfotransferase, partial [Gammaproteobacteria bacterium]|nr:sulfotransferase [Gammaproteobacteria bacterium]